MEEQVKKVNQLEIVYAYKKANKTNKYLVFLHGWGQNKECFLPVIDTNFPVNIMIIDLPGFGKSSEPKSYLQDDKTFITKQYAQTIEKLLSELQAKEIILVAHSFGARISFWLAATKLPITKMLLTGAAGIKPKRTYKYYLSVYGYKFQKILLKTPFYWQYQEDILTNSGSIDYKNASEIMKKVLIRSVNEDLKFLFPKIKQQVVLFWGTDDDQTPLSDGIYMQKNITNSNLIQVKGSHFAFLEYPELFKKELKKLIV